MNDAELAALRREYAVGGLTEDDLSTDPVTMFRRWMHDAVASGMYDPNAFVLSTASADGVPSSRLVLLKGFSERGFVFYTNYRSRKAADLEAQPRCALLFPWHVVERQVRVEGVARRLSDEENRAYFATRPRDSQLGAWASPQSEVVPDRAWLDDSYRAVVREYDGSDVPLPAYWGGFVVEPLLVEFWQGRLHRMHDRLRYRRPSEDGGRWLVERLAP